MTDAPDGLPARLAALDILGDVLTRGASLDDAQARCTELDNLPPRDRAFARLLVATVLKRTGQIDAALSPLLHTPLAELKPPRLANVLRLGAAQMEFLETKPHAAVNTSVDLAESAGMGRQKSIVNAALRRLAREGFPKTEDAGPLNTPAWLMEAWTKDYGAETAKAIANANMNEAPVDFTVKADPEKWAAALEAERLPTGSLRKKTGGFIPALPGFDEGAWWVQNAAAALPALLFGDIAGKTVIDLCAAPGGKTAQLASAGAKVTALDRSKGRILTLKENIARLKLDVATVAANGTSWQPPEKADAVLLDAPCTATGTIRHQPDVPHLKTPEDQARLVDLQRQLLLNAVKMLKPGGTLVYCTCALQKAEGENQTDWLLAQGLPLSLSPIKPDEIPGIADMLTARGELRCLPQYWPDLGGMDGFYAARFVSA